MKEKVKQNSYLDSFPSFGSKELIISDESEEAAKADVDKLEINPKCKQWIITGIYPIRQKFGDVRDIRIERDMKIYEFLIKADYCCATIRSIFFNEHLGCRQRIKEIGEKNI